MAKCSTSGCGTGHVGHYLAERGCAVGSMPRPATLTVARHRHPILRFLAGDMRALPLADGSCAGLVSFYLLHHVPRAELGQVLGELRRVLAGAGQLLVATHADTEEFSAAGIDGSEITGTVYTDEGISRALTATGFEVDRRPPPQPPPSRTAGRSDLRDRDCDCIGRRGRPTSTSDHAHATNAAYVPA